MVIVANNDFYADVYARNNGVTGSSKLVSVHFPNGKIFPFLIDCGLFQGKEENIKLNQMIPFNSDKINSVFITHNHIDHVGLLPLLVRQGYHNAIFTTYATRKLIDISLYDCSKKKDYDLGESLYTAEDVEKTLDLVVGSCYKRIIKPHKNVHVAMYSNGHLLGAAVILAVISYPGRENINLLFMGDYNDKNTFFNVERLPNEVRNMNISALFTESTYGDKDSTDREFSPCLVQNISEAMKLEKTIIFPAYSQGRCQEILLLCKQLQKKGIIPSNVLIWLDGYTSQEYTNRYIYEDLGVKGSRRNFLPKNFHQVSRREKYEVRERIISNNRPQIIISSGGNGVYGPIQKYISSYLEREDALIHYLGYCSPESKAYELVNAKKGERVSYAGMYYVKKCDVKITGECSAHGKRDQLLAFNKDLKHIDSILIEHGAPEKRKSYAEYLQENMGYPVQIGNINSEYAYRIGPSGIMRTIPTHFQL